MFTEHSHVMPPTLNKTHECQIIRKIISNCENADKVIEAFKDLKIPPQDIGEIARFDDEQIWQAGWANLRASQTRQMVVPTSMELQPEAYSLDSMPLPPASSASDSV
jgi:hypothetical protein